MAKRRARPADPMPAVTPADSGAVAVRKSLVRAHVIDAATFVQKAQGESSQLPEDEFKNLYSGTDGIIEPPLELLALVMMPEHSSELVQCIEAMEINIEGFGGRIKARKTKDGKEPEVTGPIEEERRALQRFFSCLNPRMSFTKLRRITRKDIESTGNGYWELIPSRGDPNKVAAIEHCPAHTMRITKPDDVFTKITKRVADPETGEIFEQDFYVRFRRYVQMRGRKKIFFKEWGDPRAIDRRNGQAYETTEVAVQAGVKPEWLANPIKHFSIFTSRTPYGLPRFVGNLLSVFGSRAADEINYTTFKNNNIPNLAILVSGNAMLTDGTIKRINEFVSSVIKKGDNYSKILILEAESQEADLPNSGQAKIEIKELAGSQHKDMLFQEYDRNNSEKIRRSFRLPPIFVGKSDDYSRATAEASRKLAEEQIFSPEREEMDREITQLLLDMGYKHWTYKSNSPNVTNDQDLVQILSGSEKTGGITPNLAREIIGDILNKDLPLFEKGQVPFDPDVPFSLTMAEAVKGLAALGGNERSGRNALAPNQGQTPGARAGATAADEPSIGDQLAKLVDLNAHIDKLLDDASGWRAVDDLIHPA